MKYHYQTFLKEECLRGVKPLRTIGEKPLGLMDLIALRGFNLGVEMELPNALSEAGIESDLGAYITQLQSIQKTTSKSQRARLLKSN
ncbi:MAG: hypothetical protein OXE77_05430 [Flavobacteriaceae bacterium]|nr:hypothetical protein [Flavobacteriaceae bacterium]MCY4267469.1 hypothetical protein [Flavobacteriaceae bacterium]MCY4299153.1 hypothetical protein [Flavobacteriaceae bacterium]